MYRPASVAGVKCSKSRECPKSKNPKSRDYCTFTVKLRVQFFFIFDFAKVLKFLMNVLHKKRWTGLKIYAGNGHDNGTVKQWYAEKFDSFMAVKIRIFSLKYLEACLL